MSQLKNTLNRILNWLEHNEPTVANYLQPGLSHEEIEEMTRSLPFQLPADIYDLYEWRNGSQLDSLDAMIFDMKEFMPLEKAVQMYWNWLGNLSQYLPEYGDHWFPIFLFEGQDPICITFDQARKYPLTYVSADFETDYIDYANLTSLMLVVAESMETGAFHFGTEYSQKVLPIWYKYNSEIGSEAIRLRQKFSPLMW